MNKLFAALLPRLLRAILIPRHWMSPLDVHLPILGSRRSVALSSILEPVSHLRRSQSCGLGQFPFLCGIWVRILQIPLAEQTTRPLLETVGLLLSVPDGAGQRELLPDTVLVDGSCGRNMNISGISGLSSNRSVYLLVLHSPSGLPRNFSAS